jgi:hypothetical protein
MNRAQEKAIVFALWQHCRELFVTQPTPSIWFDPRPNRRVRRNVRRVSGVSRQGTSLCLRRVAQQVEA